MINKEKLLSRMALAGYNRTSLANKLDVSINSLCDKINGKSKFDVDMAEDICSILEITDGKEKAEIFLSNSSL